jgi:glycosyltransferase involved in cell wall biosynthesis
MKVLFLSYNGLLEPILSSQAVPYMKGLSRTGCEFTLLTYEKKKDLGRFKVSGVVKLRDDLRRDGIDWRHLRYHKNPRAISTLFDLIAGAVYSLFLIISKKIDIVHVRGITPGMIMLALSVMVKVKILFDMRGLLAEEYVGGGMLKDDSIMFRLVKKAEKNMLLRADAVTVLTRKHLDLNRKLDYLASRDIPMEVIPCCVDVSKFYYDEAAARRMRDALGLNDKFILMYPGKLGTFYFIDDMLNFFACLLKMRPEAVFLIVTHDDPRIITARAGAIGISSDKIVVKTGIKFDDMPSYMRIADAGIFFINPYKKMGSSPIKMGEFLASGVPVIINPGIGDTEDIVRENQVGVVVSELNERSYERSVSDLSDLLKSGDVLKKRCRTTASRYLSVEDGVEKYKKIYGLLYQ